MVLSTEENQGLPAEESRILFGVGVVGLLRQREETMQKEATACPSPDGSVCWHTVRGTSGNGRLCQGKELAVREPLERWIWWLGSEEIFAAIGGSLVQSFLFEIVDPR